MLLVVLLLCALLYLMHRRNGRNPKLFPGRMLRTFGVTTAVDQELATLRELPGGLQMPNALYAVK